jgi:hypothetical protein
VKWIKGGLAPGLVVVIALSPPVTGDDDTKRVVEAAEAAEAAEASESVDREADGVFGTDTAVFDTAVFDDPAVLTPVDIRT